jgi:hypothetical protein
MRRMLLMAGVVLGVAGTVWAGKITRVETHVDLIAGNAYGSLHDARHSADTVQYIGCALYSFAGATRLACQAQDVNTNSLSCVSDDPEMVKIAQSLSADSYVSFKCTGKALTYLYVGNSSAFMAD